MYRVSILLHINQLPVPDPENLYVRFSQPGNGLPVTNDSFQKNLLKRHDLVGEKFYVVFYNAFTENEHPK